MNKENEENMKQEAVAKKNRNKKLRIVAQLIILLAVGVFLYLRLYHGTYHENKSEPTQDKFIALSYIGVQKHESESTTRISQSRLNEHMEALANMGYKTIGQEEVTNLYLKGEKVPQKSLFLMFEDGRRDTGVLAHEVLKEHNYLASMMTYAEKYEQKDNRFLSPRDMKILMNTSFWEHGSNGYRLEYINVFDAYKNYFGHLDSNVYNTINAYIERDYNHYLMDYIRDADRLPMETYEEMLQRIQSDYDSMKYLYEEHMEEVPTFYALMHANTGQFGTNDEVSAVNEKFIRENYTINFNREGYSLNTIASSPYDLTRMQPQANWYPNHLIMRIVDDTKEEPVFVVGDEKEAKNWDLKKGAAEYRKDTIVVTSEPEGEGIIQLPIDLKDTKIEVDLIGNLAGVQKVTVAESNTSQNKVEVSIDYNNLYIDNVSQEGRGNVFQISLKEFDEIAPISQEENEAEGLETYSNAVIQYEKKYNSLQNAAMIQEELKEKDVPSVEEGGVEYEAVIGINDRGERKLAIELTGQNISIWIDEKLVIKNLDLGRSLDYQTLSLEASGVSQVQKQYSQRNLYDDVYDGVFHNLTIREITTEQIKYDYVLKGWDKVGNTLKLWFEKVTTFIMDVL